MITRNIFKSFAVSFFAGMTSAGCIQNFLIIILVGAVVRSSNNEQCSLPVGLLSPRVRQRFDVGLLCRSAGNSYCLRCNERLWQLQDHLPTLDSITSIPALPFLPGACLCAGLPMWVVVNELLICPAGYDDKFFFFSFSNGKYIVMISCVLYI
ncbi:hypothetical protein QQ045_018524 [Rhodiola kirilowii]